MVNAVVLAGAPNDGKLAECDDAKYEALIEIHGKPMVSYVLDILRSHSEIGKIVVVCPKEVSERLKAVPELIAVEERGGLLENLKAGLSQLDPDKLALIATADIPLLTHEAIDDLLKQAATHNADIYYPVVKREACEARFPGIKTVSYTHLKAEGLARLLYPLTVRRLSESMWFPLKMFPKQTFSRSCLEESVTFSGACSSVRFLRLKSHFDGWPGISL